MTPEQQAQKAVLDRIKEFAPAVSHWSGQVDYMPLIRAVARLAEPGTIEWAGIEITEDRENLQTGTLRVFTAGSTLAADFHTESKIMGKAWVCEAVTITPLRPSALRVEAEGDSEAFETRPRLAATIEQPGLEGITLESGNNVDALLAYVSKLRGLMERQAD